MSETDILAPPAPVAGAVRPASGTRERLLAVTRELHRELHPRSHATDRLGLRHSLMQDWGFDSLSRAELLQRVEREFSLQLPDHLLGEAEVLEDLLPALAAARAGPAAPAPLAQLASAGEGEPAPDTTLTLTEVLDWHAANHAGRNHLLLWQSDGAEIPLGYAALARQARAVARGLRQAGLPPAGRVAIMLPTGFDFFYAFFGILYAGGVPVPIYPPSHPAQLEEHIKRQAGILRNAGATFLVAPGDNPAIAQLLRMQVETLLDVVTVRGLVAASGAQALPPPCAHDLALLQYTSGSTGDPKGVALTHANLLANIRAMGEAMEVGPTDTFVSWLPLYHDMGLIGAWLGSLYFAMPLVVMSPLTFLVRPAQWLWAMHRHRATLSAAPNFAFELCLHKLDDAAIAGLDLRALRMVVNASEAVSAATVRRFIARLGPCGFRAEAMAPCYGLAENAVGLTFPPVGRPPLIERVSRSQLTRHGRALPTAPDDADALEFVACGRPLRGNEVRIMSVTGELGEREEGRLQFRGPSATAGYFNNPQKNQSLFDGGWLDSGDLAYIANGDIFITGRVKDIIIRAGQHIHPEPVEAALGNVAEVRKGCVVAIGVHDPDTGTERLVILAETHVTGPRALGVLQRRLEAAAAQLLETPPEDIVLIPLHTLPKTSSGKLRRTAARELYEQHRLTPHSRSVWRQVAWLVLAGLGAQGRRLGHLLGDLAYAARWWMIVALTGLLAWPAIVLLPRSRWRWALFHRLARVSLRLMGVPLAVSGSWPAQSRVLTVVNHASYVDGLVVAAALPGEIAFVAKRELAAQWVAGPFLRALGTLFVDRDDPEGGLEDTRKAMQAARQGQTLVFFPEGTLTRVPGLMPFRLGAFVTAAREHLPVLPVTVQGTRTILRGDQWFPRRGDVHVHIGAIIAPDGTDFAAAVRLRDQARAAVLASCGEPDLDR